MTLNEMLSLRQGDRVRSTVHRAPWPGEPSPVFPPGEWTVASVESTFVRCKLDEALWTESQRKFSTAFKDFYLNFYPEEIELAWHPEVLIPAAEPPTTEESPKPKSKKKVKKEEPKGE